MPVLGRSETNLYLEEVEGSSTSVRVVPGGALGSGVALLAAGWPWGQPSRSQGSSGDRGSGTLVATGPPSPAEAKQHIGEAIALHFLLAPLLPC